MNLMQKVLLGVSVISVMSAQVFASGVGSPSGTCGTEGTIEQRIKNCNKTNGNFALVSKTKESHEVYKDLVSGLIWSDRLSSTMNHYKAGKACKADLKEVTGISEYTWRLPSIDEYKEAETHGIRKALPNMAAWFWSSSLNFNCAWLFSGVNGNTDNCFRSYKFSVRCVAP